MTKRDTKGPQITEKLLKRHKTTINKETHKTHTKKIRHIKTHKKYINN